jgi:nucleoside permease NupC
MVIIFAFMRRSITLATYALCGFANFASIGKTIKFFSQRFL